MKIKNLKLTSKVISLSLITTLSISIFTGCTTNNIYTISENIYSSENSSKKPINSIIDTDICILEISSIRKVDDNFIEITTLEGDVILCLIENISFLDNSKIIITSNNIENNSIKTKTK